MLTNLFFILLACLAVSVVLAIIFSLLNDYTNLDCFDLPTMLFTGLSGVLVFVTAVVGIVLLFQLFIIGTVGGIITLF